MLIVIRIPFERLERQLAIPFCRESDDRTDKLAFLVTISTIFMPSTIIAGCGRIIGVFSTSMPIRSLITILFIRIKRCPTSPIGCAHLEALEIGQGAHFTVALCGDYKHVIHISKLVGSPQQLSVLVNRAMITFKKFARCHRIVDTLWRHIKTIYILCITRCNIDLVVFPNTIISCMPVCTTRDGKVVIAAIHLQCIRQITLTITNSNFLRPFYKDFGHKHTCFPLRTNGINPAFVNINAKETHMRKLIQRLLFVVSPHITYVIRLSPFSPILISACIYSTSITNNVGCYAMTVM